MTPLKQLARAAATLLAISSVTVALAGCSSGSDAKAQTSVAPASASASTAPTATEGVAQAATGAPAPASTAPASTARARATEPGLARFCSATAALIGLGNVASVGSAAEMTAAYDELAAKMQGSKAPAGLADDWAQIVETYTTMDKILNGDVDSSKLTGLLATFKSDEFQAALGRVGAAYTQHC